MVFCSSSSSSSPLHPVLFFTSSSSPSSSPYSACPPSSSTYLSFTILSSFNPLPPFIIFSLSHFCLLNTMIGKIRKLLGHDRQVIVLGCESSGVRTFKKQPHQQRDGDNDVGLHKRSNLDT
jgi:hypothetical protein